MKNPKHEARSTKWFGRLTILSKAEGQIQNSNFQIIKRFGFWISNLDIVSDFELERKRKPSFAYIRISNFRPEGGYIALASVLVIASVVIIIGVTTSLASISEGQMSLAEVKKEATIDIGEACVEEALYRLKRTGTIQNTFPLLEATCSVTIVSQVGDNWVFTISQTEDNYTKKFQVDATRGTTFTLNSWEEVE